MTRLLEKKIFLCFCTPCQAVAALLGGPDAMMPFKERLWVLAGGLGAVSVPVGAVQSSSKLSKRSPGSPRDKFPKEWHLFGSCCETSILLCAFALR